MALIRIWSDEEKMWNYGNDELLREGWGRRDKETVRVNRKRDGLSVARNRFETCLMEGCLSGTHDVINLLRPGKNVRAQASLEVRDVSGGSRRTVTRGPTSPVGSTLPTGRKGRIERCLGSMCRTRWEWSAGALRAE